MLRFPFLLVASALLAGAVPALRAQAPACAAPIVVFSTTGASQAFVVPPGVFVVSAVVSGARGGMASNTAAGGFGARLSGDIPVAAGETLTVLVGQAGGAAGPHSSCGGGGGGASAVARAGFIPLIVAGGGGGGGIFGRDLSVSSASLNAFAKAGDGQDGGAAGTGTGGGAAGGAGAGGGGISSAGGSISGGSTGGSALSDTAAGGTGFEGAGAGGFGGGGGGGGAAAGIPDCIGGGGGGGYAGGGGGGRDEGVSASGGGGSSFFATGVTAISSEMNTLDQHGSVVICSFGPATVEVPTLGGRGLAFVAILLTGAAFLFHRRRSA